MRISQRVCVIANSLGLRFRRQRIKQFLELVETVFRECGEVRILDVGGTREYWNLVSAESMERLNMIVTVVNFESEAFAFSERIRFVGGNGCRLTGFPNNSFDIVHSNSAIEHVGTPKQMVDFANEIRRLAPRFWVQTPYFWFPIEQHCMTPFFHWLPQSIQVRLLMRFNLGHWRRSVSVDAAVRILEGTRLLDLSVFASLFPDARIRVERVLLLTKSLIMVRS